MYGSAGGPGDAMLHVCVTARRDTRDGSRQGATSAGNTLCEREVNHGRFSLDHGLPQNITAVRRQTFPMQLTCATH